MSTAPTSSISSSPPDAMFAFVYLKPATCPDLRPITPKRLGPCLFGPPSLHVWQGAHLALKILKLFYKMMQQCKDLKTSLPMKEATQLVLANRWLSFLLLLKELVYILLLLYYILFN
mgnify:CR=1 FL=1